MEAVHNGRRVNNTHATIMALSFAGQVQAAWGNLHDSAALLWLAIEIGEENRAVPATGRAHVNLAVLYYEWNDLDRAAALLLKALELSKRTGDNAVEWDAYRTLALVRQAQGKHGAAHEAIESAHDAARKGDAPANLLLANAFKETGLLNLEPVEFRGMDISPREFMLALLTPKLRPEPGDTDICVMWNDLTGTKDGKKVRIDYHMWDEADTENGISSMARVTGFSEAIAARFLATGEIKQKGIVAPEDAISGNLYTRFMTELKARDIVVLEEITPITE